MNIKETPYTALRNKLSPLFNLVAMMKEEKPNLPNTVFYIIIKNEIDQANKNLELIRELINSMEKQYDQLVEETTVIETPEFKAKRKELLIKAHEYYQQKDRGVEIPNPSADEILDMVMGLVINPIGKRMVS